MALLFAVSSITITLNLFRFFQIIHQNNKCVCARSNNNSCLTILNKGAVYGIRLKELTYTEHHSVVSFFVGSVIC